MQQFNSNEYLKIDVANAFGLDKEDWDVRISWFNAHQHELEKLQKQAESPALFFAGVQAFRENQEGKAIGYPIGLDATASGIQLLSVLMGCRTSAQACNVVNHPSGHRQDVYTSNYQVMCGKIGDTAKIERKDTKQALMTAMYNSKAVPRQVFGEGSELLRIFYETVKETLPGAWELNEAMLGTWRPTNLSHDWVLPDNFHVKVKVMNVRKRNVHFMNQPHEVRYVVNEPMEDGRSNGANMIHSIDGMVVREARGRCIYDPKRIAAVTRALSHKGKSTQRYEDHMVMKLWTHFTNSGFLSVRILNFLDSMNMGHVDAEKIADMIATLPKKPFKLLTVHDCFRVHPNYGNDIRQQYNRILHDIAKSNMLEYVVSQIVGYSVKVDKKDDIAADILNANYSLS